MGRSYGELVRAGRLDEVDLVHLAEEIESLGNSERKAVKSQLRRMLVHLIKQRIQPEQDGPSWRASIADARVGTMADLRTSPSLRRYLAQILQQTYRDAVELAMIETDVKTQMPQECPFTLEELLQ